MKYIGYLVEERELLIRVKEDEIQKISDAISIASKLLIPTPLSDLVTHSNPAPQRATKAPPKSGTKARAKVCKRCGADREKTQWPKAGALCLKCSREVAIARYHEKHPKPNAGMRAVIKRQIEADRKPHGADRVRAAMHRINENDDRPHDGGHVLPIIPE